ncbi:5-methyltetrahydropteroyltriglutamate--homocysteine S-methyltransferase [Actinomyces minihominis]|uniref:5-methyltetrahydropteroyltriglutamate-- homocysteine S-methyltransferase n=1 Tax=Actinomyces minihominis TaxID=2002838 RepID=UPI000C0720B7|nr:5-methyltetrahydropteroyltriglutamate--homocysteine S-methyltransferase [Actinomyces minihominis]
MLDIDFDIVGSFLRPREIKEARAAYRAGAISPAELRHIEDDAISALVQRQVQSGLKMVTDGEFRRRWWHLDWLKEFDGFTTEYLEKEHNGVVNHIELGFIDGKIGYDPNRPHPEVEAFNFLQSEAAKYPGVTAKKCISGPNMILVDNYLQLGKRVVPHYGDDIDTLIEDIGTAYQAAIHDLYDQGCRYLQIDDTSWTYLIDDAFLAKIRAMGYDQAGVLEWFRRVSTKALESRPADMTIATHFCKGNFKGHPLFAGFYDAVAPVVASLPYDGFYVEYDDERSGSFEPWSILKDSGKTLVVGLISTKNPGMETREQLRLRLQEARDIVGDNIALSPQCGFASVEEGNLISEETQWDKVALLVESADLV